MSDLTRILRIDASGRMTNSVTRGLTDLAIDHLSSNGQVQVVSRDLKDGLPFVDEAWIGANFTPADQRSPAQITKLGLSDTIVSEVKHADLLLIGLPVYNFGVPAACQSLGSIWWRELDRPSATLKTDPSVCLKASALSC